MNEHLSKLIKHSTTPNKEVIDLLSDITIGTDGAKYSHLHTPKKINTLYRPHFFYLSRHQKALANVTICERPMYVNQNPVDSFYIRYFAFAPSIQSSSSKAKKTNKNTFFDTYLKTLFSTSNLNVKQPEHHSSLFWAYIDPHNNRSLNMGARFGFNTIGYFKTYGFSRFYPKLSKNISKIKKKKKKEVQSKIKAFYKDYALFSDVHLFKNNDYFVLKDNGKIIAGIQTHFVHWRIDAMPGLKGKLAVKLLPYIPFVNKIINPKSYKFLATEGLFWVEGHKHQLQELLESVLAIQQKNSMLMWFDDADYKMVSAVESLNLGLIQKIKSDNSIEIVAKFNQFDETLKQSILNTKKYISGFDTT